MGEYGGEEERYLRGWLGTLRDGLARMKPDLLGDGKKLIQFPRIWMVALSKADLFPDKDVDWFRDLVERKACDELAQLREVLGEIVEGKDALAVAEDFVMLSSARFEPGRIDVNDRKGIDLILPLAALFAMNRQLKWAEMKLLPADKVAVLLKTGAQVAIAALGKKGAIGNGGKADLANAPGLMKQAGGVVLGWVAKQIGPEAIDSLADMAGEKLKELNSNSLKKRDYLSATLSGFQLALEKGEQDLVLFRSRR